MSVHAVLPGGPAEQRGIQKGDILVTIEGTSVRQMQTEEIATKLMGPPGSRVLVRIQRNHQIIDIELIRDNLQATQPRGLSAPTAVPSPSTPKARKVDEQDQEGAGISEQNSTMQQAPAGRVPPAPTAVPSPSTPKARKEDEEQGEKLTSESGLGEGRAAAGAVVRRKLQVDVSNDVFQRSPFPLSPPGSESVDSPADSKRMEEIKRKLDKEQKWVDKMFAATQGSGGERQKRNQAPSEVGRDAGI